jgi:hypothetical protein
VGLLKLHCLVLCSESADTTLSCVV